MSYIDIKRIGKYRYAYEYESYRVPGRKNPKRRMIRYIGRLDKL